MGNVHDNGSGKRAVRIQNFHIFADPDDAQRAENWIGEQGHLSARWITPGSVDLYIHDEYTPGGILIGSTALLTAADAYVQAAGLSGDTLELTLSTGPVLSVDLSPFKDNNNITPGTYVVADSTTSIPLINGGTLVLDTSALATDAELQAEILALPAEQYLASINVDANGDATFVDNNGATIGTTTDNNLVPGVYALADGVVSVPLEDGNTVDFDASLFATDADLNNAVITLNNTITTTENFLQQPTLAGTTISFPMQLGATYTLDLASLDDEVFTDNGDGTFTFDDGDGNSVTVATDTDVSATAISYNAGTRELTVSVTEDGNTVNSAPVALPVQTVTATAAANSLVAGMANGIVDKGIGIPHPYADLQAADNRLAASYASLAKIFSNAAAEGDVNAGRMNADGTLGFAFRSFATYDDGETIPTDSLNGLYAGFAAGALGGTIALDAPAYNGQVAVVSCSITTGAAEDDYVTLTGTFRGFVRTTEHGGISSQQNAASVILRKNERLFLIGQAGTWVVVSFEYNLLSGTGYRENLDGTYTLWGFGTFTGINPDEVGAFATLPFALANNYAVPAAGAARVFITDVVTGAAAIGDPNTAIFGFNYMPGANTPTTLAGAYTAISGAGVPGQVSYLVEGAIRA